MPFLDCRKAINIILFITVSDDVIKAQQTRCKIKVTKAFPGQTETYDSTCTFDAHGTSIKDICEQKESHKQRDDGEKKSLRQLRISLTINNFSIPPYSESITKLIVLRESFCLRVIIHLTNSI